MTPQACARGPDFLIVQPWSSAYSRASRMCLFGWSATGVSALLAGVFGVAIIPCWHGLAQRGRHIGYQRAQQSLHSEVVGSLCRFHSLRSGLLAAHSTRVDTLSGSARRGRSASAVEGTGSSVSFPCPGLTKACRRRRIACARPSLRLLAAPDARRYRAKKSLASLTG